MAKLDIDYDSKYDILRLMVPCDEAIYGDEDDNGVITFFGTDTDEIKGITIFGFVHRLSDNTLDLNNIPVILDVNGFIKKSSTQK